jgi:uncharacterized membrane protein YkoI
MKLALAIMLAFTCLGACPALAQAPKAAREIKADQLNAAQLKAAVTAKVSLNDAIAAAGKYSGGGKILEVSYQLAGTVPFYGLRTLGDGVVWEARIDTDSGELTGTVATTKESELDPEDKAELSVLRNATTPLARAVQLAEENAGGKAISAELEARRGGAAWEVVVAANGKARRVVIDPITGRLRKASRAGVRP